MARLHERDPTLSAGTPSATPVPFAGIRAHFASNWLQFTAATRNELGRTAISPRGMGPIERFVVIVGLVSIVLGGALVSVTAVLAQHHLTTVEPAVAASAGAVLFALALAFITAGSIFMRPYLGIPLAAFATVVGATISGSAMIEAISPGGAAGIASVGILVLAAQPFGAAFALTLAARYPAYGRSARPAASRARSAVIVLVSCGLFLGMAALSIVSNSIVVNAGRKPSLLPLETALATGFSLPAGIILLAGGLEFGAWGAFFGAETAALRLVPKRHSTRRPLATAASVLLCLAAILIGLVTESGSPGSRLVTAAWCLLPLIVIITVVVVACVVLRVRSWADHHLAVPLLGIFLVAAVVSISGDLFDGRVRLIGGVVALTSLALFFIALALWRRLSPRWRLAGLMSLGIAAAAFARGLMVLGPSAGIAAAREENVLAGTVTAAGLLGAITLLLCPLLPTPVRRVIEGSVPSLVGALTALGIVNLLLTSALSTHDFFAAATVSLVVLTAGWELIMSRSTVRGRAARKPQRFGRLLGFVAYVIASVSTTVVFSSYDFAARAGDPTPIDPVPTETFLQVGLYGVVLPVVILLAVLRVLATVGRADLSHHPT